jgi:hypothetical protein
METNISMQQLKEQRLTPAERFVLDKVKGAKASEPNKYGNIPWYKGDTLLFKQDFKYAYLEINYLLIWAVLENHFALKKFEIQRLINNVMYKYTNNGQLTPTYVIWEEKNQSW